jgi:two-component system cell cycle sensor histidine kinase/response regulator CckA
MSNIDLTELVDNKRKLKSLGLIAGGVAYEFNNQIIKPKSIQVDDLICNTGKLIKSLIGEDIVLKINLSRNSLIIMADPVQIENALLNLATNARDAMPHGGHLSISATKLMIGEGSEKLYDLQVSGEYVLISVADTGTGIDQESKSRLFESFSTTKEVGNGTGLGLSIVHGIIKQHNGSVLVHSELRKGTTFSIYLPVGEDLDVKRESETSTSLTGGTKTLLLVEDEEIVRFCLKNILERAGYRVIVAGDGEEAVERFMEHDDISLVLTDMMMPRKNGKELFDEINKIKPGTKVILMSGYMPDIMHREFIGAEGIEFISKPFEIHDLMRKIREVVDRDLKDPFTDSIQRTSMDTNMES